jgi:hypothetical protein
MNDDELRQHLVGIEKHLDKIEQLAYDQWTPGIPIEPGAYAIRSIGKIKTARIGIVGKAEGDWTDLEWVRLPE